MANQINKAGKSTVSIQLVGGSLETLGNAEDQIDYTDQAFNHEVPGDAHGGPAGPPIDVQFMGRIQRIRCTLSKFDTAVAAKVEARKTGGAQKNVADADIGTLMIQSAKYMRVLVSNAGDARNYPICLVREAVEVGVGTKYSTFVCEFEAHRNQSTGELWNTTAS